ncbi:hypothetical protein ACWF94_38470 [Streptomyces sp. NPDC055078]
MPGRPRRVVIYASGRDDLAPDRSRPLAGEECALVRPYLAAYEDRLRGLRRQGLMVAAAGLDLGPEAPYRRG